MAVAISSELAARIVAAAAATPDVEVCGLLLGTVERIEAVVACANVAADPARRFEIDPRALIAAHRDSRRGGARVIGHYHSHPSGRAVPSARDAADAVADGAVWVIVAGGVMRAWRAVAGGVVEGRFDGVELVIE